MPRKGQPSRGGASKKPSPSTPIDDNVIFTNDVTKRTSAKPDAKSKGKNVNSKPGPDSSKTGNAESSGPSDTAPKRPDTKTLIGGASWTGKLPVNLLSEHCQKQRWEKPEYTMVHILHHRSIGSSIQALTALDQICKWLLVLGDFEGR